MRDLKFRIWNKIAKKMFDKQRVGEHGSLEFTDGLGCYHLLSDTIEGNKEQTELMQYIGLKDKKGVEIYEGDIVKFKGKNHEIKYWESYGMFGMSGVNLYSGGVDESKPMGSIGSSTKYKPYVLNTYYQKQIEVIGNIYENPEMLK